MVDINSFLTIVLGMLGSILLVVLIILGIKLINTITKVDKILDNVEVKLNSFDKIFSVVDVATDSMALLSDKIVEGIVLLIKKVFRKNDLGKVDDISEQK